RLNQVDSLELATRLAQRGFQTVPFEERADIVVVNTCTVTARADVSDRQMIRRALRSHPGARVVVTGGWAQTDPAAVAALPGVDVVVGNADKPRLPEILEALLQEEEAREAGAGQVEPPPRPTHSFARKASTRSASAPAAAAARPPLDAPPRPRARLLPARVEVSDIANVQTMPAPAVPGHRSGGRARAFLKIQEG